MKAKKVLMKLLKANPEIKDDIIQDPAFKELLEGTGEK